ncbi:hypothetical protein AYI69_g4223 [Smittium culicis]|uniref:Uncharacterized protein n=1 Tax=Smittium culicis TaxID=133412 RepID=A0A1R1YFE4_9FUNG|nr:hypothetical protein AYI69_g4223 [Smittium culicis]
MDIIMSEFPVKEPTRILEPSTCRQRAEYEEDSNFQPQELSHRYEHVLIPVLIPKDPAPSDTLDSTEKCIV